VTALSRWTGVTAGDDLIERVGGVRRLRLRHLWASHYLALLLLAAGLAFVAGGIARRRRPPP
jgi:hypothetical protein